MKRFKTKRKIKAFKKKIIKPIIICFGLFLGYQIIVNSITNIKLTSNNEEFLLSLLNDANHHIKYEKQSKNIFNKVMKLLTNFDVNEPTTVLANNLSYYETDTNELAAIQLLDDKTYYVADPKKEEKTKDPRVYIYNSHQLENYNSKSYQDYNIKPGVMMASYILREKLKESGIESIVEEGNITDFLNLNNWDYNYCYEASRYFIKNALEKNKFDLIIDLHRDAVVKSASTIKIGEKNYARVMFVVGLENKNYKVNLELAEKLNASIEKTHKGLSRGVLMKEGQFVNGVYNQDLSGNMILIEIGAHENTIDEVLNTLEVFAMKIKEHLNGK